MVNTDICKVPKLFADDPQLLAYHNSEKGAITILLEDLPIPTVVVLMKGLVLSGGFELALAADYRIATPNSQAALPIHNRVSIIYAQNCINYLAKLNV